MAPILGKSSHLPEKDTPARRTQSSVQNSHARPAGTQKPACGRELLAAATFRVLYTGRVFLPTILGRWTVWMKSTNKTAGVMRGTETAAASESSERLRTRWGALSEGDRKHGAK